MGDEFPKWAAEEISKAKLVEAGSIKQTGYILEIDEKGRKIDVQFYDQLPEGGHIVTLELDQKISPISLKMATNYMFGVKVYKANLSEKLVKLLWEAYKVKMDSVHRYVLAALEELDIGAEGVPAQPLEEEE
jgi:CTP:phosphocholine cytidylyltransferase-like protein